MAVIHFDQHPLGSGTEEDDPLLTFGPHCIDRAQANNWYLTELVEFSIEVKTKEVNFQMVVFFLGQVFPSVFCKRQKAFDLFLPEMYV